ncbi:DMT family transporter [Cognatishimia sp. F0-27]|uniref:DMT family transporter n=1 Tax=Cognatishimia sp. F0-27 TaxID=2816855 RepID=UPI001D0C07FA|nr:DMT family transporter [Cognatishimia sp. F0-27]MCC1494091.1 DMT family transporter [Cognatishimia sp. F0-27]
MTWGDSVRLGALVFTAVTCVVVGDTAGKLLTQAGIEPVLVAWARFAIAAVVLLPLSGLRRSELHQLADWRVVLRAVLIAGGICAILTALRTEPIANVFGAFFIGPVVSYVLAVLFLGERPSGARTALLGLGFVGVMLVVQPGFGGGTGMVFALLAGLFYGAYLATTRAVAGAFRPRFLLISQLLIGAVVLAPLGLSSGSPPLTNAVWPLFLLSALGSAAGNYLLVIANKRAEASLVAPLIYTQLISATGLGVLVFGDWPDPVALTGLALIALSGFGSLVVRQNRVT